MKTILGFTLGFGAFIYLLYTVGQFEHDVINLGQTILRTAISLAIIGILALISNHSEV